MQTFAYIARDSIGTSVTGTLTADNVQEVTRMLRADGKYPVSIKPANAAASAASSTAATGPIPSGGLKIPRAEVIQLSTQLAIMVETGVTVPEALDCIAAQATKPMVKKIVEDLSRQIQSGTDFSTALSRHPRSFPRLYIALIRAAEKSGMLSRLLNRATAYMRDEQEIIRRVRGALIYPGFMLVFAVTTTVFLLIFVLPRFTAIYEGHSAALPVPTKILMGISSLLVDHWIIWATAVPSVVLGVMYGLKTKPGQRVLHYLQLNTPLLGKMFRKLYLSRGLRMLGTMGAAGVNLVDSVQTTHDLCSNSYYRALWDSVSKQIQCGKQLSEPLFESNLVPRAVSQMLSSGEKSGKLSQVMEAVSGFAEQELKEQITELTRYIEPIMIMVMGFIIGGVAMALLLPIFTISRVMAH
ncbi:MAG TPA: type II secretion system F family protein [Tepidisphaeraceae bacterium]|jgi:type II secretory pathway component PulF|nr:type II secretion system F family protein [Tepidisphaeraceae bacterium]